MGKSAKIAGECYEEYVNKFIKGKIVSDIEDRYDIETKKTVYEVKGTKLLNIYAQGMNIGKYHIIPTNHTKLISLAEEKGIKAKYIFVISIAGRKMWKTVSAEAVTLLLKNKEIKTRKDRDEQYCFIRLNEVW
jgi:hypothetical protein